MAIDFPSSPSVNDTYTFSGRTWKWNGEGWQLTSEGSVTTAMLANDAVTYAKIQNISATDKLLGRSTAGAGDIEEVTCTAAGRALLDDADATAQRTTLGLGSLATQSGTFSGTSSGTNTGDQTITLTGDVTGTGTGSFVTAIGTGVIVNADVNTVAAIAGTKISPDFGSQTITTTGVISPALGTAALPSVAFTGDTNTGIWSPAADTLAVSTGGSERARIDSSGRVGIGTATPTFPLTIKTDNTPGPNRMLALLGGGSSSGDGAYIAFATSNVDPTAFQVAGIAGTYETGTYEGALKFYVNSNLDGANLPERMRIDSSGRLLVGTSSARANFDNTTNTVRGQIEGSNGDNSSLALIGNANATFLAQPRLIFAKSQGFGTGTNGLVGNSDVLGEVSFQGNDGTEFVEAAKITCTVDSTSSANDMPGRLVFSTTADGAASPTEAMRINNQRELLIGTATRTANGGVLQVSNGITFPATAVACTDVNTLDDYEEGTWTPTQDTFDTWTSPTFTAAYTKVGRIVHLNLFQTGGTVGWSALDSIGGLPFAPGGITAGYATDSTPASDNGAIVAYTNGKIYFQKANASETGLVFSVTYYV